MLWFAVNVPTIDRSSIEVSIFELSAIFVLDVWRSRFRIIIPSPPVLDFVISKRRFFAYMLDGFFFEGLLDSCYDFFYVTTTRSCFFFWRRRRCAVNLLLASFVKGSKSFPFVNSFDLFGDLLKRIMIWDFEFRKWFCDRCRNTV